MEKKKKKKHDKKKDGKAGSLVNDPGSGGSEAGKKGAKKKPGK
jgi:hypothetical protein